MDTKDILKATESTQRLIQDADYYKYIFKKTERIVSVVFYITHNIESHGHKAQHIEDIETAARHVHDTIIASLQTRAHVAEDAVRACAHALVALDSKARVAQVSGLLAADVLQVISTEVDAVLRGMNRYVQSDSGVLQVSEERPTKTPSARREERKSAAQPVANTLTTEHQKDTRRARILTVIEARGEASIKDISEVISDVSEKTIQRELNAMIEDNSVKRQGERRWSKYMLFK